MSPQGIGTVVFVLKQSANAIFVTCFRDGGAFDAGPSVGLVVRDGKDRKKVLIRTYGVTSSADGKATVLARDPSPAKFSLMVM